METRAKKRKLTAEIPENSHNHMVNCVRQRRDDDCGPTCLEMVTGHPIEYIYCKVPIFDRGTYAPQLANYLLEHGFSVEATYFNPFINSVGDEHTLHSQDTDHLVKRVKEAGYGNSRDNKAIEYMVEYLQNHESKVFIERPSVNSIVNMLIRGYTGIALLTTAFLDPGAGRKGTAEFNMHFIVVKGYCHDRKVFTVCDPSNSTETTIQQDDLIYAIVCTSFHCVDHGFILYVKHRV